MVPAVLIVKMCLSLLFRKKDYLHLGEGLTLGRLMSRGNGARSVHSYLSYLRYGRGHGGSPCDYTGGTLGEGGMGGRVGLVYPDVSLGERQVLNVGKSLEVSVPS